MAWHQWQRWIHKPLPLRELGARSMERRRQPQPFRMAGRRLFHPLSGIGTADAGGAWQRFGRLFVRRAAGGAQSDGRCW